MDKYSNEFEACDKLKLKPGFGEFYGGNQVHITRQNDKQLEKSNYKPFEGSGNLLNINSSPNTRPLKNHYKITPYSSVNNCNRRYKNKNKFSENGFQNQQQSHPRQTKQQTHPQQTHSQQQSHPRQTKQQTQPRQQSHPRQTKQQTQQTHSRKQSQQTQQTHSRQQSQPQLHKEAKRQERLRISQQKQESFQKQRLARPDYSDNGFCVFLIFITFFYLCYLLHLANQKLYYYTGYKF